MLANFLSRFYHACWYITAAVIITAAVAVTIVRLMLPQIDDHRPRIESWLSDKSGYEIRLERLDAHWEGWTPTLNMQGIRVSDPADAELLMTLDSASITLDPLLSLRAQDLTQLQIIISGPKLLITREADGSIALAKVESTAQPGTGTDPQFFTEWVLQQRSIAIEDATITFVDRTRNGSELMLNQVTLRLRNSGSRTQIEATALPTEDYGKRLSLSMDAYGDITTPEWSGRMYLEGEQLYPARFSFNGNLADTWQSFLAGIPLDIRLWSEWNQGRAEKISGEIHTVAYDTETRKPEPPLFAADFSLARYEQGFHSRIHVNRLQTVNGEWQPAVINIRQGQHNGDSGKWYELSADYLKVDDALPLLAKMETGLVEGIEREFSGELNNTRVLYTPGRERTLYFESDIDALQISGPEEFTRITADGGRISGTREGGLLQMQAGTLSLVLPGTFEREINFYEVNGDFNWTVLENGLQIETDHFEAHTPHFNTAGEGKIVVNRDQESPLLDVRLRNSGMNLEHLHYYLPAALHEDVLAWAQRALIAGDIETMDILFRGYLHDFPYREDQGRFQVTADVNNTKLAYHPDWLPVTNLDATFRMDNNRIQVNSRRGDVHEVRIEEAEARIDDVTADAPVVNVTSRYSGTAEIARYIIRNSPLAQSTTLSRVNDHNINGELALSLDLAIPLTGDSKTSFNGVMTVADTRMESPGLGMTLTNINGALHFTRDSITTESLQGIYEDQPVSLQISMDNRSRLVMALQGKAGSKFIASQLQRFFPKLGYLTNRLNEYIEGETEWTARLSPDNSGSNENSNQAMLEISASLAGLAMHFPEPIAKDKSPAPLHISTTIGSGENRRHIRIAYNNELLAGIDVVENGAVRLNRAEIALGNRASLFETGNGLFIHGEIDRLSLSDWQDFIQSLEFDHQDNSQDNIQVDLQVGTLTYIDQEFSNTDFRVNNLQPDLYVTLEGDGIDGKIVLPDNPEITPVKANFTVLHLRENEKEDEGQEIDPRTKPAMEMTVGDFSYGNIKLGEMLLTTSKLDNGLSIDNLSFNKPGITIEGNGSWLLNNDVPRSEFVFKLKADKLDNMLSTFDYSVAAIRDGKTRLRVNANWTGSPMDFSLAEVNGNLDMDIEDGQFLDIEPAAGRLFGLLSLQTIPRRLSLDFTDLFGEGFSFDQIEGTFSLESGNAYTNNLTMTGPSANIQVTGRTGLIEKDYDQVVTVIPQVSDSLPLAGALFGPIGVGVGAVLFLAGELFESIPQQIDKLLRYQYSVKGSWDNPQVERISATTATNTDTYELQ